MKKISSGSNAERSGLLSWNKAGPAEVKAKLRQLEATPSGSPMNRAFSESLLQLTKKMNNEKIVYDSVFTEEAKESGDSNEKILLKAAKSMLEDAEKRDLIGRQATTMNRLKEQVEKVEKGNYEGLESDGKKLFQKMGDLNEITRFYREVYW